MTQTGSRPTPLALTPEERDELRERQLAVLARNRVTRQRMLDERGGVPVELDDLLDEMRGRTPAR